MSKKTQVFRDPANKQEDEWRVLWHGEVLAPSWNSRGAAQAYLTGLLRAHRNNQE